MDLKPIEHLLACPACRSPLARDGNGFLCASCDSEYPGLPHSVDFTPPRWKESHANWDAWEHLQSNGLVSYEAAPKENLGVGQRADYHTFARFSDLRGVVLDVGCGPQPWPANFDLALPGTVFVGIDPLVGDRAARYIQLRGLGEFLPFKAASFDRVLFTTSLDHFLDPVPALREAARVCKPDGAVAIWAGEKDPKAPPPATSPEWYTRLEVPAGAQDRFHWRRFNLAELQSMFARAGLELIEADVRAVDAWRKNGLYRLRPKQAG